MQVILLDKVRNLGNFSDQVKVKDGYARNFLIPQGLAVLATKENIKYFVVRRTEMEAELAKIFTTALARAEKINTLGIISIKAKAGSGGKLFGSVGVRDIISALSKVGIEVTKNEVCLCNGVLRNVGEHLIKFQLHSKVVAKLTVNVISDI